MPRLFKNDDDEKLFIMNDMMAVFKLNIQYLIDIFYDINSTIVRDKA